VLCEKPVALNAREAIALGRAARQAGVLVGEAFMVRSHPQWHEVRRRLSAGQIGNLQLMHGHFSYSRRPDADIRNRVEYGGGALMDIGCYPIMIARWMFGREPIAAIAAIERDTRTGVDCLTSGILRFDGGHASFTCGGQMVPHQRVELFGERGRIDVEIPFTPSMDRPARVLIDDGLRRESSAEWLEFPAVDQYTLQGDEFSAAIRGIGRVPTSIDDAIGNMKVIDALSRSAESGRWTEIMASS
jgi:predicted dehydrogenase